MNKVILMGRLTADPELRQTQSGISSCRFTVAVNRSFKNDKGEYDADFVSCIAWRQTAEFVSKYFSKGQMIALDGELRTGSYQDRQHPDIKHYTTDVYINNVEFCGDKKKNGNAPPPDYYEPPPTAQPQQNSAAPQTQQNADLSYGNLAEFEEILSGGDVPF